MLITFAGLPGSGKSSTAQALAAQLGAAVFLEPEEEEWPTLVHQRELSGVFTAMTWFRAARVPGLFAASAISRQGKIAVVDSYFDKLVSLHMEDPVFSWLIPNTDPYFQIALQMARADYDLLPNADVLVFLRMKQAIWLQFMQQRGREFDRSVELTRYFGMQDHYQEACETAAKDHGILLCTIEQTLSCPEQTAAQVWQKIKEST